MTYFGNILHAKSNFSVRLCVSRLNKKRNCMQKSVKMVRLLFLINSVCPNFLQLSIYIHILLMSSCSLRCIDNFFPHFLANCSPMFLYALSAIKQFEVLMVLMFFFCQILTVNFFIKVAYDQNVRFRVKAKKLISNLHYSREN